MSNFRAEIIALTFSSGFVVPEAAAALNRPSSTGGSLPQLSEPANSTELNRCLFFYEFVSE